jgi:hypothetical protein
MYTEFVCEALSDFCAQGYWTVLPLAFVREWLGLRLSPLGVVPQRSRRPCLIVDYSFLGVNQETVRMAPPEVMQFGRTLTLGTGHANMLKSTLLTVYTECGSASLTLSNSV